ncbi:class I SAM-dependent methyltransferase [Micromonospora sp. NPDC000442]|uniref:class I SAM-dependent methyltransferase n=1 Tax=Micromonospora sp. NPDC000442 TaxID=3364217 RepID=UPI003681F72A
MRPCRWAYGSWGPGQQDRLIVSLLALRTPRQAAHLTERGCSVEGVDLSPGMVAMARRNHPRLVFTVGSLTELPYPDGQFAGVNPAHPGMIYQRVLPNHPSLPVEPPRLPGIAAGRTLEVAPPNAGTCIMPRRGVLICRIERVGSRCTRRCRWPSLAGRGRSAFRGGCVDLEVATLRRVSYDLYFRPSGAAAANPPAAGVPTLRSR